ncbi:hypothetical protein PGTUg99_025378 [Puccinia graminis f. sp. tritici]|uniref:Uncharacterized protein n=1 Tax=Puccinia graminis f. sp. tritici TaxID=56615 RepID=A0A5B0SL12_PUCGR|nr:hypothetical protein PGTUg99_025378 [Puccinia graminis f. sp. tritici]
MRPSPRPETTQVLHMILRQKRAPKEKCEKDLLLTTEAKLQTLKDLVKKEFTLQDSVDHPRLWTLRFTDDSAHVKNLGTPPVPHSDAQGQFPRRSSAAPQVPDADAAAAL